MQFVGTFGEQKNHQIAYFLRQLKTRNVYHNIQLFPCLKGARKGLKKLPQTPPTINLHNIHIVQVDRGRGLGGVFEAFSGSIKIKNELDVMVDIASF